VGQSRMYQRIDTAHHDASFVNNQSNVAPPCDGAAHSDWLSLHSDDLIERLQAWGADLDAREAELNHRAAMQDQRERQFRMTQQAIIASLKEKQLAAETTENELRRKARQLAFETS